MKGRIVVGEIAPLAKMQTRSTAGSKIISRAARRRQSHRFHLMNDAVDDLTSSASCKTKASRLGSETAGRT